MKEGRAEMRQVSGPVGLYRMRSYLRLCSPEIAISGSACSRYGWIGYSSLISGSACSRYYLGFCKPEIWEEYAKCVGLLAPLEADTWSVWDNIEERILLCCRRTFCG
ncbi:hypothetical protein PIB30_059966, partial [Stylosanthes scabra]|nr:hypothetical protein [Stylosanthes scabra]